MMNIILFIYLFIYFPLFRTHLLSQTPEPILTHDGLNDTESPTSVSFGVITTKLGI